MIRLLDFPDEVVCEILAFLSPFDALYSFMDLNHRFDRLLLPFKQQIDFTNLFYVQFMYYINTVLPRLEKDGSLNVMKLGNERTPGQITLFNRLISDEHHRHYFNRIERIFLESPRLEELVEFVEKFLVSLSNLVTLSIRIDRIHDEDFRRLTQLILNSIFSIPTLIKLSIEMSTGLVLSHLPSNTMFHSLVYVNLSLSLVTDLLILIQRIPNVENLSIRLSWWASGDQTIVKMLDTMRVNGGRTSLLNNLKKFRLIIESIITFQFVHLEEILARMLNNQVTCSFSLILRNSIVRTDETMKLIDGQEWQRLLRLYSSLIQFDLFVQMTGDVKNEEKFKSFDSDYFQERKWFFAFLKYPMRSDSTVFYSIPYRSDESFNILINDDILSKNFPVNYTSILTIDQLTSTKCRSVFDFLWKHFPSLQQFNVNYIQTNSSAMNSLDIPSIHTLKICKEHQINLPNLLRLFPLIHTLSLSSFSINDQCQSFKTSRFDRIIDLSLSNISIDNINQVMLFLTQFPNLRFLRIHIQNRRVPNEILLTNLNQLIERLQSLIHLKIQLEKDIESSINLNDQINLRTKARFTDDIFDGVLMHLWF